MTLTIENIGQIDKAAAEFLELIGDRRLIAFHAPMGAGKTTFTAALCRALGVQEDAIGSPTFAIVNEYRTRSGEAVYHFDFYRIKKLEEVYDIGYENYFYSGNLCLLEWPDMIEPLMPEKFIRVDIALGDTDDSRKIVVSVVE